MNNQLIPVSHLYNNALDFTKEYPFFNFFYKNSFAKHSIINLKKSTNQPDFKIDQVSTHNPIDESSIMKLLNELNPKIVHIHHPQFYHLIDKKNSLVSIYRDQIDSIIENKNLLNKLNSSTSILVPSRKIKKILHENSINVSMSIFGEVLETSYIFKPALLTEEKQILTFAVLISENNPDYIRNVHRGLEKVLITNHEFKIVWICFEERLVNRIKKIVKEKDISKYVTVKDLKDFPLVEYQGLITDGNLNKAWSDGQYIHFLLSCLKNGKFIISRPEPQYDDILIDGLNCVMVTDFNSNKLGHLIHFFINFQEEILSISDNAKKFMFENHSQEMNLQSLKKIYEYF